MIERQNWELIKTVTSSYVRVVPMGDRFHASIGWPGFNITCSGETEASAVAELKKALKEHGWHVNELETTCEECGNPVEDDDQFCSEKCKKNYHNAYKHWNEEASRISYEESKYDDYYGDCDY